MSTGAHIPAGAGTGEAGDTDGADRTRFLGAGATRERLARPLIFVTVVAATMLRGTGPFLYDAYFYWTVSRRLVGASESPDPLIVALRGVWTYGVYVPAALTTTILGPRAAGLSVLGQNALLVAALATLVVPALVSRFRPLTLKTRLVVAALCYLCTAGFAPYPLIDLYAATAALVIVLLVSRKTTHVYHILAAGFLTTVMVNMRPAYGPTAVAIGICALVRHRRRVLWMAVAALLGLVPQVWFNVQRYARWSAVPTGNSDLGALQADLGSWVVRYDTVLGSTTPQLYQCSPGMASAIGRAPATAGELLATFVHHLPTSVPFVLEKLSATLHWLWSTPYSVPHRGVDGAFAMCMTVLAVTGLIGLGRYVVLRWTSSTGQQRVAAAALSGVVIATVATVAGSAPENRFQLPLLLVATAGAVAGFSRAPQRPGHRLWPWGLGVVVASIAVTALAYSGLAHPMPVGAAVNRAACARLAP